MKTALKTVMAVACVLVFASIGAAQNWFSGSVDEALAKAKTEGKLVLVDFYSGG